jgi:hypothetical protein
MILKNRLYKKQEPSKDAKVFIILCEGKKRVPDYFKYFQAISSKIKLEIIPAKHDGDNSPVGLYNEACSCIIATDDNPTPKYDYVTDEDEIWFVIDTDKWGKKISELRNKCKNHNNWFVAQSNPCFEVWLYYHFYRNIATFDGIEVSKNWKSFLNKNIKGGFNSKKHPVLIKYANYNSKKNYTETDGELNIACTELFKLTESFYPLVEKTVEEALATIEKKPHQIGTEY